jgi:hypothetical protein
MVTRDTRLRRAATFGLLALALGGGATACGSSADQERLRAEELARARAEGARQARIEARSDQAAVTAKELRRELNRLRKRPARTTTGPAPASGAATSTAAPASVAPAPAATGTSCGAGVIVNSVTSCPFGVNTRDTYYANRQPSVVDVYSTVTDKTYTMSCTSGSPHVCTGGNNARVTFP